MQLIRRIATNITDLALAIILGIAFSFVILAAKMIDVFQGNEWRDEYEDEGEVGTRHDSDSPVI